MAPLSWRVAGETSLILGSCGLPPWLPLIAPYDAFTTPFGITFWGILADRRCLVISFARASEPLQSEGDAGHAAQTATAATLGQGIGGGRFGSWRAAWPLLPRLADRTSP